MYNSYGLGTLVNRQTHRQTSSFRPLVYYQLSQISQKLLLSSSFMHILW